MKANELMIGDLVRVSKDVCIEKGAIVRIHAIDGDNNFHEKELKGSATCVRVNDPDRMSGGIWTKYLEPIALTPEILEKNGFSTKDEEDHWTGYRIFKLYDNGKCKLSVQLYHKVKTDCEISLNSAPYWICLKYIHELQHLIRLCGINKDIVI